MNPIGNPISELNELVQKLYGVNILTKVLSVTGPAHCPTVTAKVILPYDLGEFVAEGKSQKEAKIKAAQMAIDKVNEVK
ncbi:MAG: putative dsRNA-binding protein [Dysgonomonas sp.]|nr:putative dsRNA-binding protein [Dysgonomonas sp.]